MSDTSQGPGWWLASDGKWYPPETWTGPALPTAVPPGSPLPASGIPMGQAPGSMPSYSTPYGVAATAPIKTNGMAVASLVLSCVGIIPFLFGIPCVLGIIFGFVGRSQIRNANGTQGGSGLALAGIIVGFALIAIAVIFIVIVAAVVHQNCTTVNGYTNCTTN